MAVGTLSVQMSYLPSLATRQTCAASFSARRACCRSVIFHSPLGHIELGRDVAILRRTHCELSLSLQSLRPGGIVVDMTTSEPALAEEIAAAAASKGVESIDAPVSGQCSHCDVKICA